MPYVLHVNAKNSLFLKITVYSVNILSLSRLKCYYSNFKCSTCEKKCVVNYIRTNKGQPYQSIER